MIDGRLCLKNDLFSAIDWSQRQLIHVFERNSGRSQSCYAAVDAKPPDPDHELVPRKLYHKRGHFMAHGTSDHCPGCRALISGGHAQGHTED